MTEESQAPLRRVAPDRYSEFELVGKGGMGVVYLALDSELNRRVAFKIVLPETDSDTESGAPQTPLEATPPRDTGDGTGRSFGELKARFLQEAWVTSGMEHPGVVPVYELGETDEGVPYYTMRYVRGDRTMKEAIAGANDLDDRLFLLEPFLKVCDTIRFAHARGVVHRDIKPENIAIGEFGEVVVLDWGLAKVEGREDVTSGEWHERIEAYRAATDLKTVAGALGTPGFMAPEAALGRGEEVDARSDVYSLGVLLFRILTGRLPFEFTSFLEYVNQVIREDPPRADAVDPTVPRELADACVRALSREREERYEHVDELARAVRVWQTEGTVEREIRALLDEARDELEASQGLAGNLLLLHLDRATAALNRILHLRAGHEGAQQLQARVKRLRERGIRHRVRTDRLAVLQRVAAGLLAVGAIVALVVFSMLSRERREADDRQQKSEQKAAVAENLRDLAEARAERAEARVAAAYGELASSMMAEGRHGAGRLFAAAGLAQKGDRELWRALARAEERWTPTLRLVAYGVSARSLHVEGDDDLMLLVGDDEGRVHAIEERDGERSVRRWNALDAAVTAVATLPFGERVAAVAGGADGRVAVLTGDGGAPHARWPGTLPVAPDAPAFDDDTLYAGTAVTALAPGPRPGLLLVGYADGRVRLFDELGAIVHVARHHAGAVTAFAPLGDQFGSAAADGSINLWDPVALLLRDTWSSLDGHAVAGFRFDPERGVHAWARDGAVWTRHLDSGKDEYQLPGAAAPEAAVALVGHGRVLAVASRAQGILRFLSTDDGALLARGEGGGLVVAMAGDPDGTLLAVARDDHTTRVWGAGRGFGARPPATAHRASGAVARARSDGTIVVSAFPSADPTVLATGDAGTASAIAFDPGGELLMLVTLGGRIVIFDATTGEEIRRLKESDTPLTAAAWAQGDARVLTGDLDGLVRLWPWRTGRPLSLDEAADAPITLVTGESPGERIAAADAGGTIHLWNSVTREKIGRWDNMGRIVALAVAPQGDALAAVREDGAVLRSENDLWREEGRLPAGCVPALLELREDGSLAWLDRHALPGAGLRHVEGAQPLAPGELDPPWILIPPDERLARIGAAFGLAIEGDYRVVPVAPDRTPGAIDLTR